MTYTVEFENIPTAAAYARQVRVTDTLDANLDIRTFRLGQIFFSHYTVAVPDNRSFFQTRISLPDQGSNIVADISAGVDLSSGQVFWTMTALDLNTGEPPLSVDQGVLPPDDTNHIGEGFVTYTVKPVAGLPTGTLITNRATVFFDQNEPISTRTVTNTIDGTAPTSSVTPLPSVVVDTNLVVSWSGTDDPTGSGLKNFDIYVSDNGGVWAIWQSATTNTSAVFIGTSGHTNLFSSRARDKAGNLESAHVLADAQVFFSTNRPPVAPPMSDQVTDVSGNLSLTNSVATQPGQILTVQLINAPPGVEAYVVNGTNVVVDWVPGWQQSSSTNVVQLVITDNGVPSLSTTQAFVVVVSDYVQAALGFSALRPGQSACIPLSLFASVPLTNLDFSVTLPATSLGNWSLNLLRPELCSGTVQSLSATQLLVSLTACSGQALSATQQQIAELCFTAGSNQPSAILPLWIGDIHPVRANGAPVTDTGSQRGKIVVVAENPMVEAAFDTNCSPLLVLYGVPSVTNTIESTTVLRPNGSGLWWPVWQGLITNLVNPMPPPLWTNNPTFFRARVPKN